MVDYYRTLQIARGAEPEVIEKAYKALSLKYHPDLAADADRARATRRMQSINAAYAVLRDPSARRRYDASIGLESTGRGAWDEFMDKGLIGILLDKIAPRL